MIFSLPEMAWYPYPIIVVMITSIDLSLSIDVLTALNPSLEHRRKHILRLLRPNGDQALESKNEVLRGSDHEEAPVKVHTGEHPG